MHRFALILIAITALIFGPAYPGYAQSGDQPANPQVAAAKTPKPLSTEAAAMLAAKLSDLQTGLAEIRMLDTLLSRESSVLPVEVTAARLDQVWAVTLANAVSYATAVADLRDQNFEVGTHHESATNFIKELPTAVQIAIDRRARRLILPDPSKSAAEQAQIDARFFADYSAIISDLKALVSSLALAERFGIDSSAEAAILRSKMQNFASNASVYLDIAQRDVTGLRAAVAAMPEDKELAAKLKLAISRTKRSASALESLLPQLALLNIPTTQFTQQLVTATGTISARAFNLDVISGLLESAFNNSMDWLFSNGSDFLLQLLGFVLIIYVFYKLAGLVQKGIERALNKSGANVSQLLRRMILSSSHNLVIALGVLIALAQIGVSLGPLLAGLGIAGFIIGFALQDSLSNFASGMMILFYRPFDVGDMIEVTSASGTVSHMSLVNTTILTVDNKSLVVPNNIIWQGIITNVTARRSRRIDLVFGVGYDADLEQVEKLLLDIVEADERILKSPEPVIKVGSLGESAVNMICRPWVKTADYWNVAWDLNKTVKQTFDREGISFPFPQRDIHIYQHDVADDRD
jgi:small conductance mechanosensitive channel